MYFRNDQISPSSSDFKTFMASAFGLGPQTEESRGFNNVR